MSRFRDTPLAVNRIRDKGRRHTLHWANVKRIETDDKTRFRITTWPGQPLPHPPNGSRVTYVLTANGVILPDWEIEMKPPSPKWSEEMYLELAALDADDPRAVLDFVNLYGELGMRSGRAVSVRTQLAGFSLFPGQEEISSALMEERERATRANGLHPAQGETLGEFRWGVTVMRDLIAAWRVARGEIDRTEHRWECPIWNYAKRLDTVPWEKDGVESILESGLQEALECFSPVVHTRAEVPVFNDHWAFEIGCLELFNHIVEAADYRRCANETCGRFFVRQRGRAQHGQHRTTGVKYCSAECAKMQASRAYRRRQRKSAP